MSDEPVPNLRSDRAFYAVNALLSTGAVAFIAFILARGESEAGPDLRFMPAVNACFNALCALCLVAGYVAIRRKQVELHRVAMITAFAFSTFFLVGYLAYHFVHGDTKFTGVGGARVAYLLLLASHVLLSLTVVPLALTSFYFAITGSFARHRKLNRVFLPIWLYVSVTGVLIYFILH